MQITITLNGFPVLLCVVHCTPLLLSLYSQYVLLSVRYIYRYFFLFLIHQLDSLRATHKLFIYNSKLENKSKSWNDKETLFRQRASNEQPFIYIYIFEQQFNVGQFEIWCRHQNEEFIKDSRTESQCKWTNNEKKKSTSE